jgi:hypothetical protein
MIFVRASFLMPSLWGPPRVASAWFLGWAPLSLAAWARHLQRAWVL